MTAGTWPDVHVFVVWSRGRDREAEILADLAQWFAILDVVEVAWPDGAFARNLTRLYGQALPAGSEKERHCGTDPFVVATVLDPAPRYGRGRGGRVNRTMLEAKERYRTWTGGGHRVHASLDPREAAWNLRFLLGKGREQVDVEQRWDGQVRPSRAAPPGAGGWEDVDALVRVLRSRVRDVAASTSGDSLVVASADPWWAAAIADGEPGASEPSTAVQRVTIGADPVFTEFRHAASLPPSRRRDAAVSRLLELVARARNGVGVVLVYHGVAERAEPADAVVPAIAVDELERQLEAIAGRFRPVSATELAAELDAPGRGRRVPVAVTFDDDLASHAELAAPTLARLGIPATFFLGGTTLERPQPTWWQDLQALADAGRLDAVAAAVAEWPRHASLREGAAAIERLAPERRRDVAEVLRRDAADLPVEPGLRRHAVRSLAAAGFEIGFHTLRHDPLPGLDDHALRDALVEGREALEEAAGRRLRAVAYPHGKGDPRVAAAARAAGFDVGFTGSRGAARRSSDRLLLPRNELRPGPRPFGLAVARLAVGLDQPRR